MPSSVVLLDAAGRRRSTSTMPGYLAGRAPRNKGIQNPPDPPRPEEIILVMRRAGNDRYGLRVRALIAVLRRGGLRISEALALNETDIDERRGSLPIRHGKGEKRREAGMDQFGFEQLAAWLTHRVVLPPGPLLCVIDGSTRVRRWAATAARAGLRELACAAGCDAGLPSISYARRTRSNSPAKVSRSTSSNASSGIPTSGRRAPICRGSIPATSSTPSAHAPSRPSPPPPGSPSERRPRRFAARRPAGGRVESLAWTAASTADSPGSCLRSAAA